MGNTAIRRGCCWALLGLGLAASTGWALEATPGVTVQPLAQSQTAWNGQALVYPPGQAEVTALRIDIALGAATGWHQHPVPSFAYILQGELEVTLQDGAVKRLKAGDVLFEVVDTAHNGRNVGTEPVKLVVFYTGAAGKTLTQAAQPR